MDSNVPPTPTGYARVVLPIGGADASVAVSITVCDESGQQYVLRTTTPNAAPYCYFLAYGVYRVVALEDCTAQSNWGALTVGTTFEVTGGGYISLNYIGTISTPSIVQASGTDDNVPPSKVGYNIMKVYGIETNGGGVLVDSDKKEYGIFNIYYDTNDSFLIRESLSKPYYKEKLRVRSYYSPAHSDDKVFIEIKKKIGGIVTKRRAAMTLKESEIYLKTGIRPKSDKFMTNQVLDEIDVFKQNYSIVPAQYISYQRMAFFGKEDKDFRLTFDRNITDRRYDLTLGKECYGRQIIRPDQRLMEIKITDSIPIWLSEELSHLEIYKTSFSKYGKAYQNYVRDKINHEKGVNIYA